MPDSISSVAAALASEAAAVRKEPSGSRLGGASKKQLVQIRKLLKQRDFAAINAGVELARSLDNPELFEALLGGWAVHTGPDPKLRGREESIPCTRPLNGALVFNESYTGDTLTRSWSNRSRSYFVYALVHLIAYAPESAELDASIERSGIKALALNTLFWPKVPRCIAEFENLEYLDLRQWVETGRGNYDFRCFTAWTTYDRSLMCTMSNLDELPALAPKAKVVLPEAPLW